MSCSATSRFGGPSRQAGGQEHMAALRRVARTLEHLARAGADVSRSAPSLPRAHRRATASGETFRGGPPTCPSAAQSCGAAPGSGYCSTTVTSSVVMQRQHHHKIVALDNAIQPVRSVGAADDVLAHPRPPVLVGDPRRDRRYSTCHSRPGAPRCKLRRELLGGAADVGQDEQKHPCSRPRRGDGCWPPAPTRRMAPLGTLPVGPAMGHRARGLQRRRRRLGRAHP